MGICKPKLVSGYFCIIGLDSDGTCRFIKNPDNKESVGSDPNSWTSIVDVVANENIVIGLKKDGSCVAFSTRNFNQDKIARITTWNNVRLIAGNCLGAVALKTDGTLIIGGSGSDTWKAANTSGWNDVIKLGIPTDDSYNSVVILGLKKDGTVISSDSTSTVLTNVVDMAVSDGQAIFLKKDGTCESRIYNYNPDSKYATSISNWKDIVAINTFRNWQNNCAGTIGLKKEALH